MSKIRVDKIEADYKNLKLSTGTNTSHVQVRSALSQSVNIPGTLQLTTREGTAIYLRSPINFFNQNYTIVFPDNKLFEGAILKMATVSGDTNYEVGQLEFASPPEVAGINANDITSGTMPAERFPTDPSLGALSFFKKVTIGSTPAQDLIIDGLEDDSSYFIIGKTLLFVKSDGTDTNGYPIMQFLDENGNAQNHLAYVTNYGSSDAASTGTGNSLSLQADSDGNGKRSYGFTATVSTKAGNNYILSRGMHPGFHKRKHEGYAAFNSTGATQRIHGIKIISNDITEIYFKNSEVLVYKFLDS